MKLLDFLLIGKIPNDPYLSNSYLISFALLFNKKLTTFGKIVNIGRFQPQILTNEFIIRFRLLLKLEKKFKKCDISLGIKIDL